MTKSSEIEQVIAASKELYKAKLELEAVRSNPDITGMVRAVALQQGVQILKEKLDTLYEAVRVLEESEAQSDNKPSATRG